MLSYSTVLAYRNKELKGHRNALYFVYSQHIDPGVAIKLFNSNWKSIMAVGKQ